VTLRATTSRRRVRPKYFSRDRADSGSVFDAQWPRHRLSWRSGNHLATRMRQATSALPTALLRCRSDVEGQQRVESVSSSPQAADIPSAHASIEMRWRRAASAVTLNPAVGAAASSTPQRPECVRDHEFRLRPSRTATAAFLPLGLARRWTAEGRWLPTDSAPRSTDVGQVADIYPAPPEDSLMAESCTESSTRSTSAELQIADMGTT
jgi:hypothetical protein